MAAPLMSDRPPRHWTKSKEAEPPQQCPTMEMILASSAEMMSEGEYANHALSVGLKEHICIIYGLSSLCLLRDIWVRYILNFESRDAL